MGDPACRVRRRLRHTRGAGLRHPSRGGLIPLTGTANRTTRLLGTLALVSGAGVAYFGLVATPPDVVQGDLVRLIYVHPAVSTMAFVAFGITALASLLYLLPRTRSLRWDRLAGALA